MNKKRVISLALSAALLCGVAPGFVTGPLPAVADSAPGNIELSRKVATEGMVLLKNDNGALPLPEGEKIALFGKGQIDFVKGGGGSGDVTAEYVVNMLQGMENKEKDSKVQINTELANQYRQNSGLNLTDAMVSKAKEQSDTAIVTISRHSGEGSDRSSGKGDYYLSDSEVSMLDKVSGAGFEHVVVVLNVGGVIDTSWIANYNIDSVLMAWQPGMEGGNAVADILCGDVNPSGKLTDTFAKSFNDYPSSSNFGQEAMVTKYEEDIFVGYRYFETFDPGYEKVVYPFGYGLSYTTFDIANVKVESDQDSITVTADVKNTGRTAGKEVVQVYYSAPQGKLGKPAKELAAFQKTGLIEPGKTEKVAMTYAIKDMASYDDTGKTGHKSAYVLEKGDYKIYVGNSIKNAGEAGVRHTYAVAADTVAEQLTEQMTPIQLEKRLLADGTYETLEQPTNYAHKLDSRKEATIRAIDYYKKHYHAVLDFQDNPTPDNYTASMRMLTSDAGNRWVTYAVNAPHAGPYAISLGVGNDGNGLEDAVAFYVNDAPQSGIKFPLPNTGGRFEIRKLGAATLQLNQGLNFIKIEFTKGDRFQGVLDYITIKAGEGNLDVDPIEYVPLPAAKTKVECEKYVNKSDDVQVETISAGPAQGGKSLGWLHTGGLSISYAFDVAQAGAYKLTFSAAHGLGGVENGATCFVNNQKQENFNWTLQDTQVEGNQYFNFIDLEVGTVELPAGKCVLQFVVNEGKNMGNIDYFYLEPVNNAKAAAASVQAANNIRVSAAASAVQAVDDKIMYVDVMEDPSLMDAFIAQLSAEDLVYLSGGHKTVMPNGTGLIGYLPEYGIPGAETVDGPAGVRLAIACTAWPVATLQACTWDPEILEMVGKAVGVEAKQNGADIWLAPGLNIHRNPLCGRNFEYYSEDPLISGKMAAALTRGTQSEKVAVAIKHFAANNRETNRGYQDSRVSERALREIYLKGFEICVKEADPWTIMSSYNLINGTETSESVDLLTNILRDEWGFQGMVMSDWWNDSTALYEAIAGNDIKMGTPENPPHLLNAYKAGMLSREVLERNVKRILEMIMKTNAVDRQISDPVYHPVSAAEVTRIKALDFAQRDINIGSEVCQDEGGGFNPTDTFEGRYLTYRLNLEKSGRYKVKARVASSSGGGRIRFSIDGQNLGELGDFPNCGGWQNWATSGETIITLPAGKRELRLDFIQGGFNINWFELERIQPKLDVTISPRDAQVQPGETLQLTAEAVGSDATGKEEFVWSVEGGAAGTSISETGLLTVAENETSAALKVMAAIDGRTSIQDEVTVTVKRAAPAIVLGDMDGNGEVTIQDVMEACKVLARQSAGKAPTDDEMARGNLDGDDKFSIGDVMEICKILARKA
ncbi:MAG: carbohydrate-binding protein [Clostridiales bacterium]|nr:carbohydrate-binding protein [Clostridiales bacterium]